MRISSSQHSETIRAPPRYYWPHDPDIYVYRPALNLSELVNLLQIRISSASDVPAPGKGKKRAAASVNIKPQKRAKSSQPAVKREEFEWAAMQYPELRICDQGTSEDNVPVLSHTFQIDYNNSVPSKQSDKLFATKDSLKDWISDEENLRESLQLLGGTVCSSQEYDLGPVRLAVHSGRAVAVSALLQKCNDTTRWLLLIPELLDGLDFESLGIFQSHGRPSHDIMLACANLQESGRVAINGHLTLVALPPCDDPERFPFSLQVQIDISFTPSIYEPLRVFRNSKSSVEEDAQRRLLQYLYPDGTLMSDSDTVTNISFFYSILRPAPPPSSPAADRAMQPAALLPTLLPFQRRSVAWLLGREGKMVTQKGQIIDKPSDSKELSFWERVDDGEQVFYVNRLDGNVSPTKPEDHPALGAILAEEPGLGKTLEIISLMLLNPAPDRHPGIKRWDPEANVEVKAVKTTLIVTPPALATQWIDELKLHAPSLKVLLYEGWTKVAVPITMSDAEKQRAKRLRAASNRKAKSKAPKKKRKTRRKHSDSESDTEEEDEPEEDADEREGLDWCSYVQGFDVVITTYQTLKTDVNVARAAPKRPRREDVVYSNVERPRSPLILVEWNRVVMDEVQMVGGGNVEYVSLLFTFPRLASFAVSGTPARTQVADLVHVLKFLRVDHLVGSLPRHWARLANPGYSKHFSNFFQNFAIRTTKASVNAELTIPQQTRYLVGIKMGAVERHVYDEDLEATLLDLGLDARGVDVRGENREPNGAQLRSHLRRLRAICTHPQVGQLGDKLFKSGALKSMEEVLQTMCDSNWGVVMDDCKNKVQGLIKMAQLQQHGGNKNRYQHCLETLLRAEKDTAQLIQEIQSTIATHEANGRNLAQDQELEPQATVGATSPNKGKGKEQERSFSPLSDLDSDDEDDASCSPAAKAHRSKRQALKHRLREFRLVMHRVKFLQGDSYHMLGESQSAAESAAYEEAEAIRRALLNTTEKAATDAMHHLVRDVTANGLTAETLLIQVPFLKYKLKKSEDRKCEEANQIMEDVLNEQSSLLWEWRIRMTELLTQRLTPGDEADGQEYQRTLDDQGEAETYLINYTSLLADRREALLQERTLLAAHDSREKKLRHTKAAIKAAAALDSPAEIMERDGIELQPEHEVLHKELSGKRKDLLNDLDGRAVKSVIVEMANKVARMHRDDDPQKIMLKRAVADLRKFITDQGTLLEKLEADLALYRKAFNQRILYFRQLQEISDSVSDAIFEHSAAEALQECITEQGDLAAKINTNRARQRYLDHLSKNKVDAEPDEDEETCILCKCDFIRGFITQCAHVFCEECMKAWVAKKQGSTCPVCRVAIDTQKLERFAVAETPVEPLPTIPSEAVPKSRREISYNMIDAQTFREIEDMQSFGDYGNKIQTLVRHLLYLRTVDGGAKSIVFSAWADSLYSKTRSLVCIRVSCLRIDQNRKGVTAVKQFADSDDIDVLLLHGERENAGLNITCASRVFLLESVVHHGFEVQAIARIDRMGQTKPTEVFCYYAEDTVEKNILDLAARQGTSLYTKTNSVGSILNVTTLAGDGETKVVDSPAKKVQKGDFIFKIDDMMAILFPHMFEELEYLIPADEDVVMTSARPNSPVGNAVAGPSRRS
ncbi:SNF2 family N-terminal domain-containing protein [Mycena belliarum]|uniref:SNF2 family N-terminal domain-containing protein n=1 Tax=Mycena belliarum TaxID=1033014 RepID=A0AAD6XIX3_9AGAR|nr:SNF2 family N-terminal domain-containing protein [Mycena belliae]